MKKGLSILSISLLTLTMLVTTQAQAAMIDASIFPGGEIGFGFPDNVEVGSTFTLGSGSGDSAPDDGEIDEADDFTNMGDNRIRFFETLEE